MTPSTGLGFEMEEQGVTKHWENSEISYRSLLPDFSFNGNIFAPVGYSDLQMRIHSQLQFHHQLIQLVTFPGMSLANHGQFMPPENLGQ
jgi:hypothetical protein